MFIEFFGHTGSGKSTLTENIKSKLQDQENYQIIGSKKEFRFRVRVVPLIKASLRTLSLLRFQGKYGVKDRKFRDAFFLNQYIKAYCGQSTRIHFVNEHGFMMAVLAAIDWHRRLGQPLTITDEFMEEYLELIGYTASDLLIFLDVSSEVALQREKVREKFDISGEALDDLYSSERAGLKIMKRHMPADFIENDDLKDTIEHVLRLIQDHLKRMEKKTFNSP